MNADRFADRVHAIRAAWEERRALRVVGRETRFEAQYEVLAAVHRWVTEDVAAIADAYGDEVEVTVAPCPPPDAREPAFAVTLDGKLILHVRLTRKLDRWQVLATGPTDAPAGPSRNSGSWTRARIDDLLLAALAAFERSRYESEPRRRQPA